MAYTDQLRYTSEYKLDDIAQAAKEQSYDFDEPIAIPSREQRSSAAVSVPSAGKNVLDLDDEDFILSDEFMPAKKTEDISYPIDSVTSDLGSVTSDLSRATADLDDDDEFDSFLQKLDNINKQEDAKDSLDISDYAKADEEANIAFLSLDEPDKAEQLDDYMKQQADELENIFKPSEEDNNLLGGIVEGPSATLGDENINIADVKEDDEPVFFTKPKTEESSSLEPEPDTEEEKENIAKLMDDLDSQVADADLVFEEPEEQITEDELELEEEYEEVIEYEEPEEAEEVVEYIYPNPRRITQMKCSIICSIYLRKTKKRARI